MSQMFGCLLSVLNKLLQAKEDLCKSGCGKESMKTIKRLTTVIAGLPAQQFDVVVSLLQGWSSNPHDVVDQVFRATTGRPLFRVCRVAAVRERRKRCSRPKNSARGRGSRAMVARRPVAPRPPPSDSDDAESESADSATDTVADHPVPAAPARPARNRRAAKAPGMFSWQDFDIDD